LIDENKKLKNSMEQMDGKLAELRAHLDKETKARKDLEEKIT